MKLQIEQRALSAFLETLPVSAEKDLAAFAALFVAVAAFAVLVVVVAAFVALAVAAAIFAAPAVGFVVLVVFEGVVVLAVDTTCCRQLRCHRRHCDVVDDSLPVSSLF